MTDLVMILLAGVLAAGTVLLSGVALRRLVKRVFLISPFMLVSFITLLISDGFLITENASGLAFLILCRVLVSVIMPDALTSTLFLTQRYVHLIRKEMKNMQNALASRLFKAKFRVQSLKIYGQTTGGMMVKAIDRSKHIQQAMMSRGFNGNIRTGKAPRITILDCVKSVAAILVIAAMTVADRRCLPWM
jgi:cobalt/nickel transport system permease protein